MAPLPIFDPTKSPLGVMTMVYQDYDLLKNWVSYYEKQVGRQHLYILSHGNDPEHRSIAEGANVINIPRDPSLFQLERRRWFLISQFTNGFLRYYNWMISGDVDEIVALDPDQGSNLAEYLQRYESPKAPKSICPFGIEIVHNPDIEPDALDADGPILSKRRLFRLNANYAKPCIVRQDVSFTNGGHANNHQPRFLDDHLYLMHLRFYDFEMSCDRLKGRAVLRKDIYDKPDSNKKDVWAQSIETYKRLACQEPKDTSINFPEFRAKMLEKAQDLHNGKVTFFGGGRSKELYRLPDRFTELF
jgi:hypothetical protein